jgi:hypothetical protein
MATIPVSGGLRWTKRLAAPTGTIEEQGRPLGPSRIACWKCRKIMKVSVDYVLYLDTCCNVLTADQEGFKQLLVMLDGLATPTELIQLLDEPSIETQYEVLKIIFNCCLQDTVVAWVQQYGFIDKLTMICIRTKSYEIRCLILRILHCLASYEVTHESFRISKGWIYIINEFEAWKYDVNCVLLYCFMIILLHHNSTSLSNMIPVSLLDKLQSIIIDHYVSESDIASNDRHELPMFIPHPNPLGYI